ncbi:hypothetical protein C4D60_Mb10t11210 [Musa balbisiana]|uniref:Uncharacterized protein n=1 Tax=Musa balbisiana TaxID=52838 RepID=A0A4S8IXM8_MUSBA|nr:hypothetical protein C4D60_Mb10t11210 [Musa balbisiana]
MEAIHCMQRRKIRLLKATTRLALSVCLLVERRVPAHVTLDCSLCHERPVFLQQIKTRFCSFVDTSFYPENLAQGDPTLLENI